MKFIYLPQIDSTNIYASKLLLNELSDNEIIIYTRSQTKGKGIDANSWFSEDDKNLIFSLIYFPNLKIDSFFEICIRSSLGIIDYLDSKGVNSDIKWPNDIYVQNKKICGVLIENDFYSNIIKKSIIGVGLNLNINNFPNYLPNPISLADITNEEYDIELEIKNITNYIINYLYDDTSFDSLKLKYLNKLYRFNEYFNYIVDNKVITAKIIDVENDGFLVIQDKNKNILKFNFKKIKYII